MAVLRQSLAISPQWGLLFKLGFVALIYIDLALTLFAVSRGFNEMNPFMVRMLDKPLELVLVKVAAPPFIAWLVPSKLLIPAIALMLGVSGWNIASLVTSVAG